MFTVTILFHIRDLSLVEHDPKSDPWQIMRDENNEGYQETLGFVRLVLKGSMLNIIRIFKKVVLVLQKCAVQLKSLLCNFLC